MAIQRDSVPKAGRSANLATRLYAQNLWLRDVLEAVACELERLAEREELARVSPVLRARAMRVRQHLHESKRDL